MSKAKDTARKIADTCKSLGWEYDVQRSLLIITKRFPAGSNDGLVTCDMEYYSILGLLPTTRPGSTWGTDCGGIGAISALNSGVFTMKKSGGSKLVLKALAKL